MRRRSGAVENLEKRINDCMLRSMNGSALDPKSKEMKAMIAYIEWVGHEVEKGTEPVGATVDPVPWLDRPADPALGKIAFHKHCVTCHGVQGQGKLNIDGITYLYPPLWGPHSYTTAAGMYRLTKLSGFIKSNMPYLLSNHDAPVLTDEEAWDIAAFINGMPRQHVTFPGDWPVFAQKPLDHPFGPYGDPFSEEQHKYGPFPPMMNRSN
jgi:thiosulfate dehydrogenase